MPSSPAHEVRTAARATSTRGSEPIRSSIAPATRSTGAAPVPASQPADSAPPPVPRQRQQARCVRGLPPAKTPHRLRPHRAQLRVGGVARSAHTHGPQRAGAKNRPIELQRSWHRTLSAGGTGAFSGFAHHPRGLGKQPSLIGQLYRVEHRRVQRSAAPELLDQQLAAVQQAAMAERARCVQLDAGVRSHHCQRQLRPWDAAFVDSSRGVTTRPHRARRRTNAAAEHA
eukprot:scaffold1394_cov109-Isochrysis_galbana.AAC.27